MDYIRTSASNATSFLNPSPKDLVLAIPRAIARIGSFAFISVPERVDDLMGLRNGGSVIAEATGELANKTVLTAFSGASSGAQGPGVTTAGRAAGAGASGQKGLLGHLFGFQHVTNFGGVLTYISSRWALSCFTLVGSGFLLFLRIGCIGVGNEASKFEKATGFDLNISYRLFASTNMVLIGLTVQNG